MDDIKGLLLERLSLERSIEQTSKELASLKKRLQEVDMRLLQRMEDQGLDAIKADGYVYSREVQQMPKVVDWDQLYQWIEANRAFWLLHRRVSATAVRQLLEGGENVGELGIELVEVPKLGKRKSR